MIAKKFYNNGIKTILKGSTTVILKLLKRVLNDVAKNFLNDGTKKVPQWWY